MARGPTPTGVDIPDRRQDFLPRFNTHAAASLTIHLRLPAREAVRRRALPWRICVQGPLAASVVSLWATRPWARVPWTWLTRAAAAPRCSRTPPRPWPTLPKVGGPHGAHGSTCWRESVLDL